MSFELTLIQIFLLGSSGGIFNHKNKFKEDWILQGTRKIIYTLQEYIFFIQSAYCKGLQILIMEV